MHDPARPASHTPRDPPCPSLRQPDRHHPRGSWLCVSPVATCLFEDEEEQPAKHLDSSGRFALRSSNPANSRESFARISTPSEP